MRTATQSIESLLQTATKKAKQTGRTYMVCELDYEDSQRLYVRPEWFADTDEFVAFDGRILALAYPNGETEITR